MTAASAQGPIVEVEVIRPDRPLLSDTVVARLTQQILNNALMPGDALPSESDLAKRYGVSKPVIREALRKLAALGIVEIRHGRPTSVGHLAPEPVRQMFEFALHINPQGLSEAVQLRRALETHCAALAAANIADEEVDRLQAIVARLEASVADHDAWVEADLEFHQLIAHLSRNTLMTFLIGALSDSMRQVISTLHAQTGVRDKGTVERHRQIAAAIAARDPEGAERAMRQHFDATAPVVASIQGRAPEGGSQRGR